MNGHGKDSTTLTIALLLGIVILGAAVRWPGISSCGPVIADGADYTSEARFLHTGVRALAESFRVYQRERREGVNHWIYAEQATAMKAGTEGLPLKYGRPGHVLFLALVMELLGPVDYAGAVVSAFFGTLSIPLLFLLGRRLYGDRAGLLAALALAVSGYHVHYCRTAMTETDSLFFLLVTVFFYVGSRRPPTAGGHYLRIALTGLFCGVGFVVHHRLLLLLLLLWVLEAHFWWRDREAGFREKAVRWILLHLFFALPILLTEAPYYGAIIALRNLQAHLPFQTYLEQVLKMVGYQTAYLAVFKLFASPANYLSFPYLFWKVDGPVHALAYLVGVALLLRRRSREDLFVLLFFLFPVLYYSSSMPVMRYGAFALPFGALAAAWGLFGVPALGFGTGDPARPRLGGKAAVAAGLLLVVSGGIFSVRGARIDAGFREAMAWVLDRGDGKHISTYIHPCRVYAGMEETASPPGSEADLRRLYDEGHRYWVAVGFTRFFHQYIERFALTRPEGSPERAVIETAAATSRRVEEGLDPVAVIPNPFGASIRNLFEVNYNFRDTLEYLSEADRNGAGEIRIYDLDDLYGPAGSQMSPIGQDRSVPGK